MSDLISQTQSFIQVLLKLGWTRIEIADQLGVDRRTIYDWQSGTHRPTVEHFKSLERLVELATVGTKPGQKNSRRVWPPSVYEQHLPEYLNEYSSPALECAQQIEKAMPKDLDRYNVQPDDFGYRCRSEAHPLAVEAAKHIKELIAERDHWKTNHHEMVQRNAVLRERKDLPIDRLPAIERYERLVKELREEIERLTSDPLRGHSECPHGDLTCPCPDGLLCHYEGENPWKCSHCSPEEPHRE